MRWTEGVALALVLAGSGACGRSTHEPSASATGGTDQGGSGASSRGGDGGAEASGGRGGSSAGATQAGTGGCANTRAACACDSPAPDCASAATSLCPFRVGSCPPTLADARNPENWLGLGYVTLAELVICADEVRNFSVNHLEGGYELSFDVDGRLIYAAEHSSCNTPLCGEVTLSNYCRTCVLAPVDAFPRASDGGFGGQPSTPEQFVSCQLDDDGLLVMPEE